MRALLVEDDSTTAHSIELNLKSHSIDVDTTDLGLEAFDLGKTYDYDLILLDLNLPDISGYEVLQRWRLAHVDTPVIIVSGMADIPDKLKGFRFGADDYITKPFHPAEMIARIQAIRRRSRRSDEVVAKDNSPITIGEPRAETTAPSGGRTEGFLQSELTINQLLDVLRRRGLRGDLLELVSAELTKSGRRGDPAAPIGAEKPPPPKLSQRQLTAIKKRARERPWSKRPRHRMSAFEWVRDNYAEWIPGLLQSHLKADPALYGAFSARVSREGLPDWLDVPSEPDARLRQISDPAERQELLMSREFTKRRIRRLRTPEQR